MKYLIDIELSGLIAVEADSKDDALNIAEQIGTDELKDSLSNTKARFVQELSTKEEKDFSCFSDSNL